MQILYYSFTSDAKEVDNSEQWRIQNYWLLHSIAILCPVSVYRSVCLMSVRKDDSCKKALSDLSETWSNLFVPWSSFAECRISPLTVWFP